MNEARIEQLIDAMEGADILKVNGTAWIGTLQTSVYTGDPKAPMLFFTWWTEEDTYVANVTGQGLMDARVADNAIVTTDEEGDKVTIELFKTTPVSID